MGTKASERVREGGGARDFNVGVGVRVGVEHFYRITKSDSNGVNNWPQNRLSRVGVGISPGLLFPSLPFLFQSKADVRPGNTQDLHANLWNMAILETRIFTKSF